MSSATGRFQQISRGDFGPGSASVLSLVQNGRCRTYMGRERCQALLEGDSLAGAELELREA